MATFFLTCNILLPNSDRERGEGTNDREKRKREPLPSKTRERREDIFMEREEINS